MDWNSPDGIKMQQIPGRILNRIAAPLVEDGFRQADTGIFVKDWNSDWRGWIAMGGNPYSVDCNVGVFNQELLNIRKAALERLGRPMDVQGDRGPPLIIAPIEHLMGDDPDCAKRMSWQYAGVENDLKNGVADDLVYCLRKKAYPFIDANLSFERIYDCARWDRPNVGRPSFALPFYFPIILIKMGELENCAKYVKFYKEQYSNPDSATAYQRYTDTLMEIVKPDAPS